MIKHAPLRIRNFLGCLAAFGVVLLLLTVNHANAQRGGGITPEDRAYIQNLNRAERKAFRALSRPERREFLIERRGEPSGDKPKQQVTSQVPNGLEALEGYVPSSEISSNIRLMVGKQRGADKATAVAVQKDRGGIETGLEARFINGADCPEIDSEQWAIDYSHKRPWPAIHKGVDIPQPSGTPIRAIADGQVVGKFANEGNRKGIEVMLRHTPAQTGLPFWTYTQYTHLLEMSPLPIGARVKMGQEIGKTSNSGKMGRRVRRDALHLSVLYSGRAEWSNDGRFVIPKESFWMDPNAFYRKTAPYDSKSLAALPYEQKKVPVPYMKADGSFVPANTQRIWPYPCLTGKAFIYLPKQPPNLR